MRFTAPILLLCSLTLSGPCFLRYQKTGEGGGFQLPFDFSFMSFHPPPRREGKSGKILIGDIIIYSQFLSGSTTKFKAQYIVIVPLKSHLATLAMLNICIQGTVVPNELLMAFSMSMKGTGNFLTLKLFL